MAGTGSGNLLPLTGTGAAPIGVGAGSLRVLSGTGIAAPGIVASLLPISGFGIGLAGTLGVGAGTLQYITATGVTLAVNIATGSASLLAITGFGAGPVVGGGSLQAIKGSGRAANFSYGAGTLQPLAYSGASGYSSLHSLNAFGVSTADAADTYLTVALNLNTLNATEYSNFGFNGFMRIGDSYYGVNDSGIYLLQGSTDAGLNIDWSFRTGQMDDKIVGLKRIPEILFALRADGPIRVTVFKDDNTSYDYTLPAVKLNTIHQQRVLVGKGMRSRYFMVQLQGIANSKIELDSMQVNMTKTSRRLG